MGWLDKVVGGGVGYAVAGPAGAVVGYTLAGRSADDRGYDMSDIPFGVHVEAEHEDDEVGRRWTLRFLSEVPSPSLAKIRFLTDAGVPLSGHALFADESGHFVATAPINSARCVLYVPLGAVAYTSPKRISLEVSVWSTQQSRPAAAGKAILDAELPPAAPFRVADYLAPITSLCARVVTAGGVADARALEPMVVRLAGEIGDAAFARRADAIQAMLAHALAPQTVDDACRALQFRFPGVGVAQHVELLKAACFAEGDATAAQRAELERVSAALE